MVYDGRLKSSDEIVHLFAKGPRNQDEVDILTEHIQREAKLISDAWTDKERETRAKRAGTPTPVPYSVQVVQVSKIQRVDTDG